MEHDRQAAVTLRDVRTSDLEVFFEHQADPEANRMAAFAARDREAHLSHWAKILANETMISKTIEVDDEVAGNVGSWIDDGRREIGYWIGKEHWGRGIATSALSLFVKSLEERPLYAYVVTHNIGSVRVLEKCGFIPEGRDGDHIVYMLE
jgi:RimJ/RimL family protein N-acetyltransferase